MTKPTKVSSAIEPTAETVKLLILCNVVSHGSVYGVKGGTIDVPPFLATELLSRKPAIVRKA